MGFLDKLFGGFEQQSPTPQFSPYFTPPERSRYLAGELYEEAESLRKAGHPNKAENKYLDSIKAGEADDDWRKYGAAPAMYESLAKLYYHTNRDKQAVKTLNRYIAFQARLGKKNVEIETLRDRMKLGDFRRVKQKGWDYGQTEKPGKGKPS